MKNCLPLLRVVFFLLVPSTTFVAQNSSAAFHWNWHSVIKDDWETVADCRDLSVTDKDSLLKAITAELRPRMHDLKVDSEDQLLNFAAKIQIHTADLSATGKQEILAQAFGNFLCSPTGNCEAWIFRRDADGYSVILKRSAVQAFTIQPTVSHGFHDMVLGRHGSATEQGLRLFRFDGSAYRLAICYDANWSVLGEDGQVHDLKEPRITAIHC
jgi:hypothetical protein